MKILLASLSLAVLLAACGKKMSDSEIMAAAQQAYDAKKVDTAIIYYQQLVADYPESPRAPEALYLHGSILQNDKKDYAQAVKILAGIDAQYTGTPYAGKGLFLGGFIAANVLNDVPRAKQLYEKYLASYSALDANITASVKVELANLGKSAEEVLQSLQQDTLQQPVAKGK